MKFAFTTIASVLFAAQATIAGYVEPQDRFCQKSCFGYQPQCGDGSIAVKLGDCWTCCNVPTPPPYGYDNGGDNNNGGDSYDNGYDNDYDNGYDNSYDNGYGK